MEQKISIDRVVEAFLSLAGEEALTSGGAVFCRTAAATVSDWLDENKDICGCEGPLCYAAATVAYYRYTLKASGTAQTVKAGDITVTDTSEKTVAYAEGLMRDAIAAVEHLFKPRRFAFIKTEVL